MIPQTFDQWKNCIVNDCKTNLTKDFAQERLAVYQNKQNQETKKFISLYGEQHYSNVINWLRKIKND
jgi:hypothetical protein